MVTVEAHANREYFKLYSSFFDEKYQFDTRHGIGYSTKQNASDVINALLNYGYTVLAGEITKQIVGIGLDPYYSFYHKNHESFQSLTYDMIEPFRWLVEKTVYRLGNAKNKKLQDAYQENIKKIPESYLKIKSKRSEFSPRYYRHNRKQVRQYCIDDCKFTKELSQYWVEIFGKAFEFYPTRWISSGYLAEKVLINHNVQIPFFRDLPYELQEFAFNSYFGGRFEMLKRGFIGEAWLYDINSAYPYALSKIPDITKGSWREGLRSISKKALMGFFKIEVKYPDDEYLPAFAFRRITLNNDLVCFPSGNFITFATLEELKNVDSKNYSILDSWQYFDDNPTYPFKEFVDKFYNKRLELKNQGNPLQLPIKIILNAIYGKMGAKQNRRIGNLFNPVIFAFITGFARAQLVSFVKEHKVEKDVVAFATDSVCITKELDVNSSDLGGFSLDKHGKDVYFLQNGFYRFNGSWKLRGLGKLGKKDIEHIETIEREDRLYYSYKVLRTKKLASAIIQNQIGDIGKLKEETREVNLNGDDKRFWLGRLENINDCKSNKSTSLNPEFFKRHFELNDDHFDSSIV